MEMIKNYLLTTGRFMRKHSLFSAINLLGLALGLMSCILIILFIRSEMGYDTHWKDSDRIVRLHTLYAAPGQEPFATVRAAGKMMPTLSEYAREQVETGVRLMNVDVPLIREDGVAFNEQVTFVDRSFFDVFDVKLIAGEKETVLRDILTAVISSDIAAKYFGEEDPIGKTVTLCCLADQQVEVRITGVFEPLRQDTHLNVQIMSPIEESMWDFAPNMLNTFSSVNTYTYFKLKPGVTADQFQQRVWDWINKESPFSQDERALAMVEDGRLMSDYIRPTVMPITDIYLKAKDEAGSMGDMKPLGDQTIIYTFAIVAAMVLFVASINFMNLSTAQASRRAREVALRKVLGANRGQVARQFIGESLMISLLALLIALVAIELVLPYYNQMIDREISLDYYANINLLLGFLGLTVLTGLISGIYPALVLSKYKPAGVLKANQSGGSQGSSQLRSVLVIFQFAISIGLVVCTAVIYGQTVFATAMDPGYSVDSKLVVSNLGSMSDPERKASIRDEMARIPGVKSVVLSSDVPSQDSENNTFVELLDSASETGENINEIINYYSVDYGFMEAYDIATIAGRTFDRNRLADGIIAPTETQNGSGGIMMNESAIRKLGIASPDKAIGRTVRFGSNENGFTDLTIIGVIPDLYFRSLKFGVRPSLYRVLPNRFREMTITFDRSAASTIIDNVRTTWRELASDTPFDYQYLDEMLNAQYAQEVGEAKLFAAFATLAMIIACLGLYGLASFTAQRRTKEIGVRKVLGARIKDIITLLVWQFSRLVLFANIIAWPIAIWFMLDWLEGFQYRLDSYWLWVACIVAGLAAMMVAWGTVAGHAAKVARANPIHALRAE